MTNGNRILLHGLDENLEKTTITLIQNLDFNIKSIAYFITKYKNKSIIGICLNIVYQFSSGLKDICIFEISILHISCFKIE